MTWSQEEELGISSLKIMSEVLSIFSSERLLLHFSQMAMLVYVWIKDGPVDHQRGLSRHYKILRSNWVGHKWKTHKSQQNIQQELSNRTSLFALFLRLHFKISKYFLMFYQIVHNDICLLQWPVKSWWFLNCKELKKYGLYFPTLTKILQTLVYFMVCIKYIYYNIL